jgi:hypothetical protein
MKNYHIINFKVHGYILHVSVSCDGASHMIPYGDRQEPPALLHAPSMVRMWRHSFACPPHLNFMGHNLLIFEFLEKSQMAI